jgi:hypothetical protein
MNGRISRALACFVWIAVVLIFLGYGNSANCQNYQTYRRPLIDMPLSLSVGTVRTTPFQVKKARYAIMIQAEERIPIDKMMCMLGLSIGPYDYHKCGEPLLQLEWIVRDGERVVAQGTIHQPDGDVGATNGYLFKYVGYFKGESKRTYVLEVKFAQDATALNVTNPHLIVMLTKAGDNMAM